MGLKERREREKGEIRGKILDAARELFVAEGYDAVTMRKIESALKSAGARRIRFLCLVAAPEGVQAMLDAHPDVPVYTATLDRQLNELGYILPGLGDAGDRLFGTRSKE